MATTTVSVKSEQLLRTEIFLGQVLRIGVILSGAVIATGVGLSWLNADAMKSIASQTLPALMSGQIVTGSEIPRSVAEFAAGLGGAHPDVVIALGLLMLISLPIIRVALTVFVFLHERDWIYLCITLFVLSVLLSGVFLGKAL